MNRVSHVKAALEFLWSDMCFLSLYEQVMSYFGDASIKQVY